VIGRLLIHALSGAIDAPNVTAISAPAVRCNAAGCCNTLERRRADRRYCSNACRQRAYRKRKA
jgi:hypothetical protein